MTFFGGAGNDDLLKSRIFQTNGSYDNVSIYKGSNQKKTSGFQLTFLSHLYFINLSIHSSILLQTIISCSYRIDKLTGPPIITHGRWSSAKSLKNWTLIAFAHRLRIHYLNPMLPDQAYNTIPATPPGCCDIFHLENHAPHTCQHLPLWYVPGKSQYLFCKHCRTAVTVSRTVITHLHHGKQGVTGVINNTEDGMHFLNHLVDNKMTLLQEATRISNKNHDLFTMMKIHLTQTYSLIVFI
ncbi:hypothetical protein ROZALSC1DRAFT_22300 [Rozella allomycis CSF55]|uniref:Uncharacterized protein n=1 Tax=Rozella allomycis (strain CSF55) TaxID=988480 RepID=A0A4P9YKP3_ROZAC|nr:hypothetical protein ROZALSC1DRAFT_22300 [Rozella allomycis CSF55]